MKSFRTFVLAGFLAVFGTSLALAQPGGASGGAMSGGVSGGAAYHSMAQRSVRYAVSPVENSGISGSVLISNYGNGKTVVVTSLFGAKPGGNYPEHFHTGDCGSNGAIVVPLNNVSGDTGMAVTVIHTPYEQILDQDLYLNIHASPNDLGTTILACGEVGQGAQPMTGAALSATPSPSGGAISGGIMSGGMVSGGAISGGISGSVSGGSVSGGAVNPQEFQTLKTASYQIYPVNGSGISGVVQITEKATGGTRILVTLQGLAPGHTYPDQLHAGDCGSEGSTVVPLQSVPETSAGLSDSSLTDADASFDSIAKQNLYLSVNASPNDLKTIVACGEVGEGANSQ